MATIEIIRHKVSGAASSGGSLMIADGEIISQKIFPLTAANQKISDLDSAFVATGPNEVWTIIVMGGDARIAFGKPDVVTASPAAGWPLFDGTRKPFAVKAGLTAAIISA